MNGKLKQNKIATYQNEYALAYNNLAVALEQKGIDINLLKQVEYALCKLMKT